MDSTVLKNYAFSGMRNRILAVGACSILINVLGLAGSIYMLQIYDRVLPSRSGPTLLALTLLVAGIQLGTGVLDFLRGRIAARMGATLQSRLDGEVFMAQLREGSKPSAGLKHLEAIQKLMSSPVFFAVFDMPWAPVYLIAIYVFNPWLGHLALGGALILVCTAVLNQICTKKPEAKANVANWQSDAYAARASEQSEVIRALGMRQTVMTHWQALRMSSIDSQLMSSDVASRFSNLTKYFRLFLQSAVLGFGAYLVIRGEMGGGAMIAGSILLGRALLPIEQAISGWLMVQRARHGWTQLAPVLESGAKAIERTELPTPVGELFVSKITYTPRGWVKRLVDLENGSFGVGPGKALGVIGPSGSGKSTIARLLAGAISPDVRHCISLGGAAYEQYDPDTLGKLIGYLPQDVPVFDGTIAANIARLQPNPNSADVIAAAKKAGAHEMILRFAHGYDTIVGSECVRLSGGQRQRIGLARAFYGDPVLLILDEPDSNLDSVGHEALTLAIRQAKADGKAVVIMSHREESIAKCDVVMVLQAGGKVQAYGLHDVVMADNVRRFPKAVTNA